MIVNIEELVKKDRQPSVLLMFGEEEFLLNEALEELLKKISTSKESEFDLETLDGNDITIEQLVDCCNTFPFIANKRIVLVKNFDKLVPTRVSKKNAEDSPLTKYLNSPQETTFLILISQYSELNGLTEEFKKTKDPKKIKTIKYPYNTIVNKHEWIEFPKLYESQLPQWIISRLKNLGKIIAKDAVELLVSSTNPNLRDINNEILKISIYTQEKELITVDDVSFVVGTSRNYNVFELQKSIGQRNLKDCIIIIQNMLSVEKQQMLIMTMLVRYFISLWKLLEESERITNQFQLASAAGVSSYFLKDYTLALRNYSSDELDNAFTFLTEADEKLKSTSTDSIYILQKMLVNILDKK